MKRVLLVNDSKFEALILKDLFGQVGYESKITDEFNALVEVESFRPELVVANYIMEETRGDRLIQLIKAGHPEMICLISSNSQLDRKAFKDSGVDNIMRTPVSLFTLKDLLRRTYAGREVEKQEPIGRQCDHCKGDLSGFSATIMFCPFCGEEVNE